MTKKEKLEKLLQEIPCLYEDYQRGEIKKYSYWGKFDLQPEELSRAKSVIRKNKLLGVIEQDMLIAGVRVSLINYIIDEVGFSPKKMERINPELFFTIENEINEDDYKQIAYVFQAYCYNVTWNQFEHGEIGIVPFENTVVRIW